MSNSTTEPPRGARARDSTNRAREDALDRRLAKYGLDAWSRCRTIAEILAWSERCNHRGCPFPANGCPDHGGTRHPRGYHATARDMRQRHNHHSAQSEPLDRDAAKAPNWRIQFAITDDDPAVRELLATAKRGNAHRHLGFHSWAAYVGSLAHAAGVDEAVAV